MNPSLSRPIRAACAVGLLAAAAAAGVIGHIEKVNLKERRESATIVVKDRAHLLERQVQQAVAAAQTLGALVGEGRGSIRDFDSVAKGLLPHYQGASALGLAPGGVVRSIAPLAGNEGAIGHDMLKDPDREKEAALAVKTGRLTLAGPFHLVQGGDGAVARLPVYLHDAKGRPSFWGFTTVLIRFPETLDLARISDLKDENFSYELWRISPDDGSRLVIDGSKSGSLKDPVSQTIAVPNATWTLSIAPVAGWADPVGLAGRTAAGLLISILMGFLVKLLLEARAHETELEGLVAQRTAQLREELAERQNTERRLAAAVAAGDAGVWELDPATGIFKGNDRAFSLLGLPPPSGGLMSLSEWKTRVHPEDLAGVMTALQGLSSGAAHARAEYRIFRPDGEVRFLEGTGSSIVDGAGRTASVIGMVMDVTDRKKAEKTQELFIAAHRERQKEMAAVRQASILVLDPTLDIPVLLKRLADILPAAFQFPEIAQAKVRYGPHSGQTEGFKRTPWQLRQEFSTNEGQSGELEVVYLEERPREAQGPFLNEESQLLETIARMLGASLERRGAE